MKKIMLTGLGAILTASVSLSQTKVDLRISDDETFKRPNSWSLEKQGNTGNNELLFAEAGAPASRAGISIAWRNANQVEEVEVRVQNYGEEAGTGKVYVDVLDEFGNGLLHLEPPDEMKLIRVPAYDRGGKEGKIIRMKASWELNALIDQFDRSKRRYGVKATIETTGEDKNWLDNAKIKEWNIPFKLQPGFMNVYNYVFKNTTEKTITAKWLFDHSDYPQGISIKNLPSGRKTIQLPPGGEIKGTLFLQAPARMEEGAFLEARLSLVNTETNRIFQQHEWFQVFDTEKPVVTNYRAVLLQNHTIAIQALVADKGSGVLEATGVTTEFSVDGGKTWAVKAHNYKVGNFVRPTLFETVLGPFAPETKVLVRFTAMDTYGNAQTIIPADASAFIAPPNAELLLQQAYIFPRTSQNMVFELEKVKNLGLTLEKLKAINVDIASIDLTKENALGIDPAKLKELNMDQQRLNDIKDDLKKLSNLKLDVNEIVPVSINRVKAIGESILEVSTLEFIVK
jgi:hypothetical protein